MINASNSKHICMALFFLTVDTMEDRVDRLSLRASENSGGTVGNAQYNIMCHLCFHLILIFFYLFVLDQSQNENPEVRSLFSDLGSGHDKLKGILRFFWKYAHFTTPPELNCWVLPFLNPFSRSPVLAVPLLA